ncbi:hypothetical protein B1806_03815 [Metallibacterium scheffleri]|uniref:Uncharacterized protein n=1 Tax=Metallibacterium scheffleri TaxID=993689 RepID=A0A4S3KQD7_9GAMM|nr:hypothetical protein B1806_03815 [Metallibacterium scheffleri]
MPVSPGIRSGAKHMRGGLTLLQRFANRRDDSHRMAVALHGRADLRSVSQFQIRTVNQGQRALPGTTQVAQIVWYTPPII